MKGRKFENADYDAWLNEQMEENCNDRDGGYVDDEEARAEYEADASEAWHDKWGW